MDKVSKFLLHLSRKERFESEALIGRIISDDLVGLDNKKLKGTNEFYRVRKGSLRIIFHMSASGNKVIFIGRRNNKTYKDI